MHPYQAYRRQQSLGWTRIDMLLALFDGAIERLERALAALRAGEAAAAEPERARCRLIVSGLAAGINPACGEVALNFQRLYEFVLYSLGAGGVDKLEGALHVLLAVRDGFREARPEAVRLEQQGEIPPLDGSSTLQALA